MKVIPVTLLLGGSFAFLVRSALAQFDVAVPEGTPWEIAIAAGMVVWATLSAKWLVTTLITVYDKKNADVGKLADAVASLSAGVSRMETNLQHLGHDIRGDGQAAMSFVLSALTTQQDLDESSSQKVDFDGVHAYHYFMQKIKSGETWTEDLSSEDQKHMRALYKAIRREQRRKPAD